MINYRTSLLSIFASFYKPHVRLFALDLFCASMIAGIDLAFPVLTKYSLDRLLPENKARVFAVLIAGLVGLFLLRMLFSYFVTYWGHTVGVLIESDIRREIFSHLQTLPFSFYDKERTGALMGRVTTDLFDITELAHHGPEDLFIALTTIIGAFIILVTFRWEMAVVLLVFFPVLAAHTMLCRRNLMRASKEVKQKTADILSALESSISGVRVALSFTNEDYEMEKFALGNEHYKNARRTYYKSMAHFHSKLEFMINLLSVVVLAAGGLLIMRGRMPVSDLIVCNMFAAAFLQPIRRLQNFVESFTVGFAGFSRFVEIMRTESDIIDKTVEEGAVELERACGDIAYRNVSFAYNKGKRVLSGVNLSIPRGKTVAIVGPSGGGKTTLCHLLPRFYETIDGSITLDGRDIRDITLKSLRRNIGIVSQDVFLFASSIRDNIRYGRPDATDAEIAWAAQRAEIHADIMKMPDGYDSMVGERGIKLSGGQKQRVSIARIFLKNPPVLILDEATSALDSVTEMKIQQSLEELSAGRTVMVIAHRLSTIRRADRIIVIDEDGIRESGTHDELLARNGLYAELYRTQNP
ncbi:MAG: ABC transporter ATP-binding protein/permease [Spirochaetaceae bacterium]|jgi:ATP-binding cassette subfamily B protein|nr:ABC transporter ATP-binding protein/permease [Spirochaetaceae bacterium]